MNKTPISEEATLMLVTGWYVEEERYMEEVMAKLKSEEGGYFLLEEDLIIRYNQKDRIFWLTTMKEKENNND